MTNSKKIDVTQETIDKALRGNSSRCVVADAIHQAMPQASRISVDLRTIAVTIGDKRYHYITPERVAAYIVAFDAGDTIHPFTFRLRDDSRIVRRRQRYTEEGAERQNAYNSAVRAQSKLAEVEADPDASERQIEAARQRSAAAVERLAQAQAKIDNTPDAQVRRTEDHDPTSPDEQRGRAKRAFVQPRNQRQYGVKGLRINDPNDTPGDYHGPLDVEVSTPGG